MAPQRQDFTALIGQAREQVNGIYEADYRDFDRDTYIRGRETFDATWAEFKRLYRFYFKTRKFSWVMTRKLSDTLSRNFVHSCGMVSRMNA